MQPPSKSRMERLAYRVQYQGFESLTPSERSAFAMRWLYLEVNNGGLHQFFFNDAGKLASDALRGLEFLGALRTAGILRQAMSVFPNGIVPMDQQERREFLDLLKPEQEELLSKLTTQFFQECEPIPDLLDIYIEVHPNEFPT